MRVTREEIRKAFEEVLRTGSCVEIGTESGLFLQKGAEPCGHHIAERFGWEE